MLPFLALDQVKDELSETSSNYNKFIDKKTDYLVQLSNTNPKAFEAHLKEDLNIKAQYNDAVKVYNTRNVEMAQELQYQLEQENRKREEMDKRFSVILQQYQSNIDRVLNPPKF